MASNSCPLPSFPFPNQTKCNAIFCSDGSYLMVNAWVDVSLLKTFMRKKHAQSYWHLEVIIP